MRPEKPERIGTYHDGRARIERAIEGQGGSAQGDAGYAVFAAPTKPVPAPPPAPAVPVAPEPAPTTPPPPLRSGAVSTRAAAREIASPADTVRTYTRPDGGTLEVDWSLGDGHARSSGELVQQIAVIREQNATLRRDLVDLQRSLDSAELRALRKRIVHDMVELAPLAKAQAKAGKPALFRLLVRAAGIRSAK